MENSISWIARNLSKTNIPGAIELCKDKARFRQLVRPLYPDFFFREVCLEDIAQMDVNDIKMPFIIKPSVGFFSIGVYKIACEADWKRFAAQIRKDMEEAAALYPEEVMGASRFILEECIDGDEYAIDAYYDNAGKPVILNILRHPFSSDTDVSDRIYYTSKGIILEYLEKFSAVLNAIGQLAGFANFPVHAEVRVDGYGNVLPIELNPMRFAGWCVTDLAFHAYGINTYRYYFEGRQPDWNDILKDKDGKVYSLVLIDMPKGVQAENIERFDYDAVLSKFSKVLECRKIDFGEYPVFAFVFIETAESSCELSAAQHMDFKNYITVKGV